MSSPYPTASSLGGYTCARCNAFVPNGSVHSCPSTFAWVNPPPPPPKLVDLRIAEALERIAAALEAQNAGSPT